MILSGPSVHEAELDDCCGITRSLSLLFVIGPCRQLFIVMEDVQHTNALCTLV